MKTRIINVISIMLVAVGTISGVLIFYNYSNVPHLISKEDALQIIMKTDRWSQSFLDNTTHDSKLIHVITSQYAFLVDTKTLKDITPYCPANGPCVTLQEISGHGYKVGQYIWMIKFTGKSSSILSGREYEYSIDATNGQLLKQVS